MATLLWTLAHAHLFGGVLLPHGLLAISIALFGLGAGGVFSYVVAGWKAPLYSKLGRLSSANSILILLALWVILAQGACSPIGTSR